MLTLAPPPIQTPAPPPGPPLPRLKGVTLPPAHQVALRETPGAVVVVEGTALSVQPEDMVRAWLRAPGRNRSLLKPTGASAHAAQPLWMNPDVIRSGGNVIHRTYPIGWGF